ncbi:MAG: hypothetical protein FWG25_06240 [Promicromonosporaceae bacterium]|nr:hypothetical protein [Promicromonosporaceae bacterium]
MASAPLDTRYHLNWLLGALGFLALIAVGIAISVVVSRRRNRTALHARLAAQGKQVEANHAKYARLSEMPTIKTADDGYVPPPPARKVIET